MADAAHAILTRPSKQCTGTFFVDDDVLKVRFMLAVMLVVEDGG